MGCLYSKSSSSDCPRSVEFAVLGEAEKSVKNMSPLRNQKYFFYEQPESTTKSTSNKPKNKEECRVVTFTPKSEIRNFYSDYCIPIYSDSVFDNDLLSEIKSGTMVLFTEEELENLFEEFSIKDETSEELSFTKVKILTSNTDNNENRGILSTVKENITSYAAKQIIDFIFTHFKP
ncbi:uncharacterized protein LOC111614384 [Centruroides sculpturatus]|uniref:uncharacterized protein LOC111614384 n=1 Tax=Centruroides sculpturatus TaxID=218467 RepID=UPI000C6CFEC0|nr:uncharacterized protein LOC111614384 [Centruroides sculpturatus]